MSYSSSLYRYYCVSETRGGYCTHKKLLEWFLLIANLPKWKHTSKLWSKHETNYNNKNFILGEVKFRFFFFFTKMIVYAYKSWTFPYFELRCLIVPQISDVCLMRITVYTFKVVLRKRFVKVLSFFILWYIHYTLHKTKQKCLYRNVLF